tara:strand:+ start:32438 stop:32803 length:366 start_codon:yes stop_codon:yes gene_type:complete
MDLAKKIALQGTYGGFKHGAILLRGGKIINTSCNKNNHCAFGSRFRQRDEGTPTLHAEIGCILNLDRSTTAGATMLVVRVGKTGEYRMSKPCSMCREVLKHVGIKKVYYTDKNGELKSYKN